MQRCHQLIFITSLLALSWLIMMAAHEFGHVIAALITGGRIDQVVLHPLAISRTDVSPNPHPAVVVWSGPILGCVLPVAAWLLTPDSWAFIRKTTMFFAGFCLVANGSYIACGAFDGIGDSGVMLSTGSPMWGLIAFGIITVSLGLLLWHRLGSPRTLISHPDLIAARFAYGTCLLLLIVIAIEWTIFGR